MTSETQSKKTFKNDELKNGTEISSNCEKIIFHITLYHKYALLSCYCNYLCTIQLYLTLSVTVPRFILKFTQKPLK